MTLQAAALQYVKHLEVNIAGRMDLRGVGQDPWLAPVVRFDAAMGFAEEMWLAAVPETALSIHLSGTPVRCCFGRHEGRLSAQSTQLALTPKGAPNHYLADGPLRFGVIYLPDTLLDRAAAMMGSPPLSGHLRSDLIFVPNQMLHHHVVWHLRRAFDFDEPPSALEMEARTLLVLERIMKLHVSPVAAPKRGGLAPWQLRRTKDYLAARLAEEVGLAELAAVVDLSPFHFARAFKVSTGLPPHRYQLRLRLKHAQELLAATGLSIGEVAAAVGYETPQSFARLFRREFGTTPSKYRRNGRS